jgi:hypothetical protein
LLAAFATAPGPWRVASIDYPLAAVLGLAVTAPLCAHTSVLAIAEWGNDNGANSSLALCLDRERHCDLLHLVVVRLGYGVSSLSHDLEAGRKIISNVL